MIPAALLVVAVPLVGAVVAYGLRRWQAIEIGVAVLSCIAAIALLARPLDSVIPIPGTSVGIALDAPLDMLGRVLRVRPEDRIPIILLFAATAVLFVLSWRAPQGWPFVPVGLVVLAAMSLALLIRPFVYAALAFEGAAALAALMIQAERSGERSALGALRYLSVITLALPLFLFAGWSIDRASTFNLGDAEAVAAAYSPAIVLLIGGFGLMLGAIPLYTWVHPVSRDSPPLTTAFLATVGVGALTFLMLEFWQAYEWLRVSEQATSALTVGGLALLMLGGSLAWAQATFSRVMTCAILVEIGCLLLLIVGNSPLSVEALAFAMLARALSLGVFGLGVGRLRALRSSDDFTEACGVRDIWTVMALGVGGLSLAGFPGTLGFVSRWTAARAYGFADVEALALLIAASASIGIGTLRGLIAMFSAPAIQGVLEEEPAGDRLSLLEGQDAISEADDDFNDIVNDPGDLPLLQGEALIEGELSAQTQAQPADWLDSPGARWIIGAGVAAIIVLGIWPSPIATVAKSAAAQYGFYP